jgi:hypothetical protein
MASGISFARARGTVYLLMGVVNEKNTNTLPAKAGFTQFAPRPPKVHFATTIAKKLAMMGMNKGMLGLIFRPTSNPVRKADPSQSVSSWLKSPSKNSNNTADPMDTATTNSDLNPNA